MIDHETALFVLMYRQSQYIDEMVAAVNAQTVLPGVFYVCLDRPTVLEKKTVETALEAYKGEYRILSMDDLPDYMGNPNTYEGETMFLAGFRRNQAIDIAINERPGLNGFVFIDGDCIPDTGLIEEHGRLLKGAVPLILIGRRREDKHNGNDQRELAKPLESYRFFDFDTQVLTESYLFESSSVVWSCNVSFNRRSIDALKHFNRKYYERDEVFSSEFNGTWGGEDTFLGMEARLCSIPVVLISGEKSGVWHKNHPRPARKYGIDSSHRFVSSVYRALLTMVRNDALKIEDFEDMYNGARPTNSL